ncbi:MAG: hypothetical protein ACR2KI_01960 [Candidatus Limnocylindria bacterium]
MNSPERARLQIGIVVAVYRAETRRLHAMRLDAAERDRRLTELRVASMTILDNARAVLDGQAAWHRDILVELDAARAEVSGSSEGG